MIRDVENISDNLLVKMIRQNDKSAFKLLYDRYSRKIYFFALKYLGNDVEAEELVQSVFINVWENRVTLDPENSVKSYIYKAAVNHIYNYLKKKAIHTRFIESQIHKDEPGSNVSDDEIIFHDLEKSINLVVESMPSQQQKIFQLSRYEGLTHKEIARKLDLSVRTVENQMYRALKKLKTSLKEIYFFILF
jgi:RNA polymerase sigma-70 factor, ECF subfamily